jgi:predicted RNase H-like HicB family nuclease
VAQYVGILDGASGVWGVRVPDFPGCHGGGSTPDAALADAISALREFAAHEMARGVEIRPPRALREVMADPIADFDPTAGESLIMVPLLLDRGRSVKANISLDAGLLEAIDEEAERRGLTRSAFFTSAALDKIRQAEIEISRAKPRNADVFQAAERQIRKPVGTGNRADARRSKR